MSRYGKVESGFWHNPKVRPISEGAKFLLLYLLSCPHGNAAGCFVLPDGYVAADLSWGAETVSETLSELFEKGLAERDAASNLLRITGWWGHNKIENANVAKHVAKEITSLPNCETRQRLIDDLMSQSDLHETVRQTLSERLPKPSRNQEPILTQPEPNISGAVADATRPTDDFEKFWEGYPKRQGANPKEPARKLFLAAIKAGTEAATIIEGARRCAIVDAGKIGTEFIPQAVTWLEEKRWQDYPPPSDNVVPIKGYYAAFGSDQLEAWDAHSKATTGKTLPRDSKGGWHVESEWPPGDTRVPTFLKREGEQRNAS